MHAHLLISNKVENALPLINKLAEGTRLIEFPVAKIDDVRQLRLFTKVKLREKSTILINNFGGATEDAQNAFLKNLEEPQENLQYILTARSESSVLPTVLSRCLINEVGASEEVKKVDKKISDFINSKTGDRLGMISKIKSREDAESFLEDLLYQIHLSKPEGMRLTAHHAMEALNAIKHYGNVQLQLSRFVVNLNEG